MEELILNFALVYLFSCVRDHFTFNFLSGLNGVHFMFDNIFYSD